MKGLIVVNYTLMSSDMMSNYKLYLEAAEKIGIDMEIKTNLEIWKHGIPKYTDFVLFQDKDINVAKMIEAEGIRVLNSSDVIDICGSKIKTYNYLREIGVSQPKTYMPPLAFNNEVLPVSDYAQMVCDKLGNVVVTKGEFGSHGDQVYRTRSADELVMLLSRLDTNYLNQEYIGESCGRDVRVQVVGGRVVAAIERRSSCCFIENMSTRVKGIKTQPNSSLIEISQYISNRLYADFLGIDFLYGKKGYLVCGVNSNMHISRISSISGINIAELILEYISKSLYE